MFSKLLFVLKQMFSDFEEVAHISALLPTKIQKHNCILDNYICLKGCTYSHAPSYCASHAPKITSLLCFSIFFKFSKINKIIDLI